MGQSVVSQLKLGRLSPYGFDVVAQLRQQRSQTGRDYEFEKQMPELLAEIDVAHAGAVLTEPCHPTPGFAV